MADGSLVFDTKVDTSGFNRGTKTLKQEAGSIQSIFKSVGKSIAAAFTVQQIVQFGKESLNLASDLQEVQNVVDTAFGSMKYKMEEFADTCVEMYGMSKLTAKEMGSTFMAMAKGMGQTTDVASDMAVELTGRMGDIMSFYNKTTSEVNTIGKAIYTGETEPLKAIGIVMTETNLEAYTLAKGYEKLYTEMSASEKLLVRQKYFLEQTSMAAGDFEKTQGSWANQTRILSEQWKEFMTIIGNGLIQVLTPAVKTLNTMLSKLIDVGEELSAVFGITVTSNVSEEAAKAQEDIAAMGDSIEAAEKQAKGSTASFDDLVIIGGGESGTGGTDTSMVETRTEEAEATQKSEQATGILEESLRSLGMAIQWVGEIFKTSFLGTFGNTGVFDSIRSSFDGIKQSILGIFNGESVGAAALGFVNSFIASLGSTSGALIAAGAGLLDNLLGGMQLSLSENAPRIQGYMVSMFNIGSKVNGISSEVNGMLSDISSTLQSEDAKRVTADIISIFSTSFMNITELGSMLGTDVLDLITSPFIENKEQITAAVGGTISAIGGVIAPLKDMVTMVFDAIKKAYEEHVKPMVESFKKGFAEIVEKVLDLYNQHILPVLARAGEKFAAFKDGPLKDLIDKFLEFSEKVAGCITLVWEQVLQPFILWFMETIAPVVGEAIRAIIDHFLLVGAAIAAVIGSVFDILGALIDFVGTGFTEGWEVAWGNLKSAVLDIFEELKEKLKGIINGIIGSVEGMANSVVGAINTVIDAMNGLNFDIPDWVPGIGGESYGFSIPKLSEVSLPRLATGTVVPPNFGEFAAILGDNKRETEVVSPLSTMKQALKEALMEAGGSGGGDIYITLEVDGEQLHRVVVKQDRMFKKQTGKSAFAQ